MALKRREESKRQEEKENTPNDFIQTGSTLLNCCCSDDPFGGFTIGTLVNIIGDSQTGKTLLALNTCAEVANDIRFKDYDIFFDDIEKALQFKIGYLFGKKAELRIDTITYTSTTIQSYYGNLQKVIRRKKPFIYIVDSWDALTTEEEKKKAAKYEKAPEERTKKEEAGSYGTEKAKYSSLFLRMTCDDIKKLEALVIAISQTRQNLGWGFSTKTRAGGDALRFYASHEMWLSYVEAYKRKDFRIGADTRCLVSKNKRTGKVRECQIPIFYDYGIDDIRANIMYLLNEEEIEQTKETIDIPRFKIKGTLDNVCKQIEEKNKEHELKVWTGKVWQEVEEELRLKRKPRYE